jgi:hypothetical protein
MRVLIFSYNQYKEISTTKRTMQFSGFQLYVYRSDPPKGNELSKTKIGGGNVFTAQSQFIRFSETVCIRAW